MNRAVALCAATVSGIALWGCGSSTPDCTQPVTPLVVTVSPANGTANHAAAAPGNQAQFSFTTSGGQLPNGCATPAVVQEPQWTSSDPTDIQFDNNTPSANGLATCVNATPSPATVTVTVFSPSQGTGTAQLTCQ